MLANLFSRNNLRPTWWVGTLDNLGDCVGAGDFDKAVKDATHNVKAAARIVCNTDVNDCEALQTALYNESRAVYELEQLLASR